MHSLTVIHTAETYAITVHAGQMYGDKFYSYHLQQVVAVTSRYTTEQHLIDAAWLHDVIEDTSITYFDLTRLFGVPTANVVWACTGVGANRKARQRSILSKLALYPGGPLVKMADRIANLTATLEEERQDKFVMYWKEDREFSEVVQPYVPLKMFDEYKALLKQGEKKFNL